MDHVLEMSRQLVVLVALLLCSLIGAAVFVATVVMGLWVRGWNRWMGHGDD